MEKEEALKPSEMHFPLLDAETNNQNFSDLSPVNLAYYKSENRFVNQVEENQSGSPMYMASDIAYVNNSQMFDQYVDLYDFQIEANFAEDSIFDFREEAQFHKLEKSEQPLQVIYNTNKESLESSEVSEESQTLDSTSLQSIKYSIHKIGNQLFFSFDDEVER